MVRLLHDISQHPIQDLDYLHDLHRDLSCGRCVKVAAHSGPAFPARSSPPEAGAPEKPNTFQATSALPSAGRRATFPPWRCFNYYTDHTPREAKGGGGPTRRAAINGYYRYYYFLKRSHMILRKFIRTHARFSSGFNPPRFLVAQQHVSAVAMNTQRQRQ